MSQQHTSPTLHFLNQIINNKEVFEKFRNDPEAVFKQLNTPKEISDVFYKEDKGMDDLLSSIKKELEPKKSWFIMPPPPSEPNG